MAEKESAAAGEPGASATGVGEPLGAARLAAPTSRDPAVQQYSVICLLALLLMLVVLLELGQGEWAVAVALLGCICMLLQVRFGPPLVLLAVGWLLLGQGRGLDPWRLLASMVRGRPFGSTPEAPGFSFSGVTLSAALLVYSIGFYRLMSLTQHVFPVDPRRKRWAQALKGKSKNGSAVSPLQRRPAQAVGNRETPLVVMSGLVWPVLAWLFWEWLARQRPMSGFGLVTWRGLILFWLFGMGLVLTSALLAYLSQDSASPEASALYLQDQLWQQTRGEQSRINRWLVGARLRRQQKEEP